MIKPAAPISPATIAGLTKPATIWRTMAQASNKAALDIFTFHAPTLASAYTSVKQLENALQCVRATYGLNKIFKVVLAECKDAATAAEVFENALIKLTDKTPAKPKEKKPADVAKVLELIGTITDTVSLAQIAKAIEARATVVADIESAEPALV